MNQLLSLCFKVAYLFFTCMDLMCLRKESWWVEMDGRMDGEQENEADKEHLWQLGLMYVW